MGLADPTTSGVVGEVAEEPVHLVFSFQEDAPCANESALVARFCVQLLLKRDTTSPSSLSQYKQTEGSWTKRCAEWWYM